MTGTNLIVIDDESVCLTAPGGSGAPVWQVRWADIAEVAAWKHDLFSYDLLCIGLRPSAGTDYFACDETQPGWPALLDELERRFGVRTQDWWRAVVLPAFEEKFTLLWRR